MNNLLYHIRNSKISSEKLSQLTGILPEKLNEFITGKLEPSLVDVRKISKALKISVDFLVSDSNQFQDINLLFRKNLGDEKNQQAAEKCSYVIGNSLELLKDSYTVKLNIKKPENFTNTFDNATALANEFRLKYFNADYYSPITSLPEILSKELNCIVYVLDLGPKTEGASAIIDNIPFIFIAPRFEPRMLFTLAHELAHIIAHHDSSGNFALIDGQFLLDQTDKRSEESFAHHFASALLLPAEGVGVTLKKVRQHLKRTKDDSFSDIELLYLSRIYGVSFEVAASRCEQLGIMQKGTGKSMYEAIKKSHGSPEKRADALNLPSRVKIEFPKVSSNLIHSAIQKINAGTLSLGQASEILSLPINDLLGFNSTQE